jgi:hypothetical protein
MIYKLVLMLKKCIEICNECADACEEDGMDEC